MYHIQEGELLLDGRWQDQSINVLLPLGLPVQGANLVVARDKLPEGLSLADYVAQQQQLFRREMRDYTVIQDAAGMLDGRAAHFLEFTWQSDGRKLHQMMTIVAGEGGLLNFTASIPGGAEEETRKALLQAMRSFRFFDPPTDAAMA